MCAPKHFTVEYAINPWMDPTRPVDTDLAMAQWTSLRDAYLALGHSVDEITPEIGLPDMVFAANSGTIIAGQVLGARFLAPERQAEAELYRSWFEEHGFARVVMPSVVNEGEGDLTWTGQVLLAGSGFRTDVAAHSEAQELFGVPVVSLRLVDPRFYHLDTALMVLSPADETTQAHVAYFPGAFSAGSLRVLERMFPEAVLAGPADAEVLGLNGVSDGRNVVLPAQASDLAEQLSAHGYEPVMVDVSELRKAGGGPKCCTLELRG